MTPTNAVQHARAWSALVLLAPLSDERIWSPEQKELAHDFESFRSGCEKDLSKKVIGCRAERMIADQINVFCRAIGFDGKIKGEQHVQVAEEKMAEALVAVCHMIADVKITCRAWCVGKNWFGLDKMAFEVCRDIVREFPSAEVPGVALYEKLAGMWD